MYFIREIDGHEPIPKIEIKEGAWEHFFQISTTIHSDKSAEFRGNLADHGILVVRRLFGAHCPDDTPARLHLAPVIPRQYCELD